MQSADRTARALMVDVLEEVAHNASRHGADPAAEVLRLQRELVPAWVEVAGKDVADKAVRGLACLNPMEALTPAERRAYRSWQKRRSAGLVAEARAHGEAWQAYQAKHFPAARRCLPWRGAAFALAVLVLVGGLGTMARAGEAPARWKALAACGVVSMQSPEYDRRCRRFSRTERSVVRDYDFPGAGAPKKWERPKVWETLD